MTQRHLPFLVLLFVAIIMTPSRFAYSKNETPPVSKEFEILVPDVKEGDPLVCLYRNQTGPFVGKVSRRIRELHNEGCEKEEIRQQISAEFESEMKPILLFALWDSGKVVWAEDRIAGKGDFYTANISTKRVKEFLKTLHGVTDDIPQEIMSRGVVIPHMDSVSFILQDDPEKVIYLETCHELVDTLYDNQMIVSRGMIGVSSPEEKESILAKEPPSHLLLREKWSAIQDTISHSLPPADQAKQIDLPLIDLKLKTITFPQPTIPPTPSP